MNPLLQKQLSEEMILKQIREGLWLCGAQVFRISERIPQCFRRECRHNLSDHGGSLFGPCTKCGCRRYVGRISDAGIPDLFGWIVCRRKVASDESTYGAVVFFIEVKKPGGRRRKAQEAFINKAHAAGIPACFAESFDEVVLELKRHGIELRVK